MEENIKVYLDALKQRVEKETPKISSFFRNELEKMGLPVADKIKILPTLLFISFFVSNTEENPHLFLLKDKEGKYKLNADEGRGGFYPNNPDALLLALANGLIDNWESVCEAAEKTNQKIKELYL
jgi:hypothetical protein